MDNTEENDTEEDSFFSMRANVICQLLTSDTTSYVNDSDLSDCDVLPVVEVTNKRKKCKKDVKSDRKRDVNSKVEVVEVEDVKTNSGETTKSPEVTLSRYAARKLKRLQQNRVKELEKFKNMTNMALLDVTSPAVEIDLVEEKNEVSDILLRFSYLSRIAKLKCSINEKFLSILPKVADLFKLKASELVLCLKEKHIQLSDTPQDLKITIADVIECFLYKSDEEESLNDKNRLQIFFQSDDSKEKISIFIHELEKMEEAMKKYAEIRSIPVEKLVFEFDGEIIKGCETPNDMGLESENCIDVRMVRSKQKNSRNRTCVNTCITLD